MSKKRKTRKQKEQATLRHTEQIQHVHIDTPTYSIDGLKTEQLKKNVKERVITPTSYEQKDAAYLKHDMVAITAATGIIVAFNIFLFVLLSTGTLKLNFLGY